MKSVAIRRVASAAEDRETLDVIADSQWATECSDRWLGQSHMSNLPKAKLPAAASASECTQKVIPRAPDTAVIARDLADQLFSSGVVPIGSAVGVLFIASGLLYARFSPFLIVWAAAGVLLAGARFLVERSYWRHRPAPIGPDFWLRCVIGIGLTSGFSWGSLGVAAEIAPSRINELVVPVLIMAVSAAAVTANTSHPPMIRAVIYPACILSAAGNVLHPDAAHSITAVLEILFLVFLEGMTRRTYGAVVQTLLAKRDKERSRDHLARAQKVAAMGSAELNLVTGTEEWSDELYRLWGVEPRSFSLTEENILATLRAEDRARFAAARQEFRAGRAVRPGEFRVLRPDGGVRTLYVETDLERDRTGKPIGMLVLVKDVTELRAAEKREQEMEQRMLQSQKLEALGTLAGGVAHELNNAMVPIIALTKTVARKLPEESRERHNLTTVIGAAERSRDLVGQILAFSRREDQRARESIDPGQVLRRALTLLRATVASSIQIKDRIDAVPVIDADHDQLEQIVINLVNNAAQAIGETTGTIEVGLRQLPDDGYLCLSVVDSGCGMDEATKARIFEPFFTTKGVGKGTGLGLSVVHGIVNDHGGRIEVESAPGQGTRFDVILPIAPPRPDEKSGLTSDLSG
jgi:signal transduction histidine kinase